jgi:hypothetical protein
VSGERDAKKQGGLKAGEVGESSPLENHPRRARCVRRALATVFGSGLPEAPRDFRRTKISVGLRLRCAPRKTSIVDSSIETL